MAATLFGTVLLVGGIIAAVAGLGMADVQKTHTARVEDRATEKKGEVSVSNADAMSAAPAMTAIAEAALPDASRHAVRTERLLTRFRRFRALAL
jgi:hypothetical protein